MTYDRENLKVGFWKTNCSELWEELRVSDTSPAPAPTPTPTPSSGEGSTPVKSPASAPNGVPSYVIPGIFTKCSFSLPFEIEEFHNFEIACSDIYHYYLGLEKHVGAVTD